MRCLIAVVLAATVAIAANPVRAIEVGPDPTPLLFDRLRSYSDVVIATAAEGFEKNTTPVRGTNTVSITFTVERTLKGDLKPGPLLLDAHENLPALLAQRDKDAPRRYLLVMQMQKGHGHLGGGQLYVDLERIIPADAGLEKAATELIKAEETTPAALVKLIAGLFADKEVDASAPAERHLNLLLTRLITDTATEQWKAVDAAALKSIADRTAARLAAGKAADSAPALLLALSARTDNPAGLATVDAKLAEPVRLWLASQLDLPAAEWQPDYLLTPALKSAIALLAKLKDQPSRELLTELTRDERWTALRQPAYQALQQILSPEEFSKIPPPEQPLPPGMRRQPGGLIIPDQM